MPRKTPKSKLNTINSVVVAAFDKAVNIRDEFLNRLDKCTSLESLEGIKAHLEAARGRATYSLKKDSTKGQKATIKAKESEINSLIKKLEKQFPKVVEEVEVPIVAEDVEVEEEIEVAEDVEATEGATDTQTLEEVQPTIIVQVATYTQIVEDVLPAKEMEDGKGSQPVVLTPVVKDKKQEDTAVLHKDSSPVELSPTTAIEENGQRTKSPLKDAPASNNSKPKVVNPEREKHLIGVSKQLNYLFDKIAEFEGKKSDLNLADPRDAKKAEEYKNAQKAVRAIYNSVANLYNQYITDEIELDTFKTQAKPYLHEENENVQALQSHRGFKQIFFNLLAAIFSAGVIYGIAALAKGSFLVFNPSTDSGKKAQNLSAEIERATAAPAA
jgi:hypothetical protein